jgi:MFS transporter, ACS family, allantoate permease
VKEAPCDPKVWILVAAIFFHNMTNSLQTTFQGIILKGFGYTTYQAVLLSIPGGMLMAVTMLLISFFLSTWGEGMRILAIILCYIPGIVSGVLLYRIPVEASTRSVHLFAIIFISIVAVSAGVTYSLLASNIAGYTKKVVAGTLFSSYCVANIVSPQTFLASQAPRYQTGVAVTLAAFCINIILFGVLYMMHSRANVARDNDPDGAQSADATVDLIDVFSDLTDKENKKMRYKL